MVIKRYTPKYKILAKLKQALWLNKKTKIKKFKKQKWDGKVRLYFPRKVKTFYQDSSVLSTVSSFDYDRATRLKKTYKYLLQDKQVFQLYYGERRLRLYQLKRFARIAKRLSQNNTFSYGRSLFHLMENRLEVGLCRLGFSRSLMQSRKLLTSRFVKVDHRFVSNFGYQLFGGNTIKIEGLRSVELLARYLKYNVPFFYFRKRDSRRFLLFKRKECIYRDFLARDYTLFLNFLRFSLLQLKN